MDAVPVLHYAEIVLFQVEEGLRQLVELWNQLSDVRDVLRGALEGILDRVEEAVRDVELAALQLLRPLREGTQTH